MNLPDTRGIVIVYCTSTYFHNNQITVELMKKDPASKPGTCCEGLMCGVSC